MVSGGEKGTYIITWISLSSRVYISQLLCTTVLQGYLINQTSVYAHFKQFSIETIMQYEGNFSSLSYLGNHINWPVCFFFV